VASHLLSETRADAAIVTNKITAAPTSVPPMSERIEMSAESIGFTLKSDAQTLRDIEQIQENAIKAAQDVKKFALR
jgi:hypothetical protein